MVDTSDRKSIRAAEKRAALAEQNRREVLVQIMSTAPGREWIWNRLSAAGIFTVTAPTDALMMAFMEGNRNQGVALLDDVMQSCPDEFILSMRESNARRTESESRNAAAAEHAGGTDSNGRAEASGDDPDGGTDYTHPSQDARAN